MWGGEGSPEKKTPRGLLRCDQEVEDLLTLACDSSSRVNISKTKTGERQGHPD